MDLIKTIDEFEVEDKKGIGTILPYRPSKEANFDNIRRFGDGVGDYNPLWSCLLYTSPSPRDKRQDGMPSTA